MLVAGAPFPTAASGPTTTDPAARKTQVDRERNRLAEQYDETLAAEADLVASFAIARSTLGLTRPSWQSLDDYSVAVQRDLRRDLRRPRRPCAGGTPSVRICGERGSICTAAP